MKTGLLAGVFALAPAVALAATVDLDSTDSNNGATLSLGPGSYSVTVIDRGQDGGFTAWNAWGRVAGCAGDGTGCDKGWLTNYTIRSASLGQMTYATGQKYATAAQAVPNALTAEFTLAAAEDVTFLITDSNFGDNEGGVSLSVTPAVVPLPAALPFLSVAAGSLALLARRRREG